MSTMVPAALLERLYGALACWADPAELVEVEDPRGSLDSPRLELVWEALQ